MKKYAALICAMLFLFTLTLTPARAMDQGVVSLEEVQVLVKKDASLFLVEEGSKPKTTSATATAQVSSTRVIRGFKNALLTSRPSEAVKAWKVKGLQVELFGFTTIQVVAEKIDLGNPLTVPEMVRETVVLFDDGYAAHRYEKYDGQKLLAKLFWGTTTEEFAGIYYDASKQVYTFCYAEGVAAAKPSSEPTAKPSAEPTAKPSAEPTASPTPAATPKVTPEPSPTQAAATPKVTAEPEREGDNGDGGYGPNPLEKQETAPVDEGGGGYGGNPLQENVPPTAEPKVTPSLFNPLGGKKRERDPWIRI